MEIRWTERSRRNLESILEYIEQENPEVARDFVRILLQKSEILREHPAIGRIGKEGTRELVVHKNYILVYRVRGGVEILRVKHARQRI